MHFPLKLYLNNSNGWEYLKITDIGEILWNTDLNNFSDASARMQGSLVIHDTCLQVHYCTWNATFIHTVIRKQNENKNHNNKKKRLFSVSSINQNQRELFDFCVS